MYGYKIYIKNIKFGIHISFLNENLMCIFFIPR